MDPAINPSTSSFGTLDADFGLISDASQGNSVPFADDPTDIFTGGDIQSATIFNEDFTDNLNFEPAPDPSEFQLNQVEGGIGACRDSVSTMQSIHHLLAAPFLNAILLFLLFSIFFFCFPSAPVLLSFSIVQVRKTRGALTETEPRT